LSQAMHNFDTLVSPRVKFALEHLLNLSLLVIHTGKHENES
jgi:hypothetical protein